MSEPVLRVEGLEAGYDEVQVLWGISIGVARGGMTTLVGTNGARQNDELARHYGKHPTIRRQGVLRGDDVTRLAPTPRPHVGWSWCRKGASCTAR